ncbi:hypothetical protein ISCGN_029782 [Ixodes scapularis]
MRLNFEQAREERDRLRVNVSEANTRAALLAQEVDEHHAKLEKACERKLANLEKRHQEQLRELQEQLEREREAATAQLARLNQRSHEEMATLRSEEARLRAQCIALQQDNGRLELELQEFSERYSELHRFGESQQKELEGVAHLKQRVADLESGQAFLNDEHCQKIFHELESTQKQNKELKDCNDELSLELETLRQQLAASSRSAHSKRHRRSGSWVADYSRPGAAGGGLKRRGSEASSSEESDDDNPVAEKIRRRTGFPVSGAPEDERAQRVVHVAAASALPDRPLSRGPEGARGPSRSPGTPPNRQPESRDEGPREHGIDLAQLRREPPVQMAAPHDAGCPLLHAPLQLTPDHGRRYESRKHRDFPPRLLRFSLTSLLDRMDVTRHLPMVCPLPVSRFCRGSHEAPSPPRPRVIPFSGLEQDRRP